MKNVDRVIVKTLR